MKQGLTLGAVALISLLAGVALYQFWFAPEETGKSSAKSLQLDAIPLTDLDGQQTVFADWRGDVLVVNFWAPWCAPCRREIPTLIELQNDYADRGLKVLGIAFDGREPVVEFADEYQINFPLFLAGNGITMYNAALGNPSGALPFTVVLDRNLEIQYQHNGEVTRAQLQTALEGLI